MVALWTLFIEQLHLVGSGSAIFAKFSDKEDIGTQSKVLYFLILDHIQLSLKKYL